MKKYQPNTAHYRELIGACRAELMVLGYSKGVLRLLGPRELLMRMEELGKTRLEQIEAVDIKAHYAYLRQRPSLRGEVLSPHSIEGHLFELKLFFAYAERHGLVTKNPMSSLRFPRPAYQPRYVCSQEEITRLYKACRDDRDLALMHLLYGCGLRRMEASALNVDDVDYRRTLLFVRLGKGQKRRTVPMSGGILLDLRSYQYDYRCSLVNNRGEQAFLLNNSGTRLRKGSLSKYFKHIAKLASVDDRVTPHVMRHSIATHLLEAGMRLEEVRDFLGHKHLETTQIYTRVQTENL